MNLLSKIKLLPDALNGMLFSDPNRNGEYRLLKKIIREGMIIFDIGANVGEYTSYVLSVNSKIRVHCFEPSKQTFELLKKNLATYKDKSELIINNFGLSDKIEEGELFIYTVTGGSNSLYFNENFASISNNLYKEKIKLDILDDYIVKNDIKKIDFMKVDVEGHEYKVLLGAHMSLSKGIIKRLQFEYNNYWLKSGFRLITALNMLKSYHYKLYRLTPYGMIKIYRISSKLENYKHSNYYALL